MPTRRPNLEYCPESPYAREMRGGAANMRFQRSLEAAYRVAHLRRVRLRVRIWHSVNVVPAAVYTAHWIGLKGVWSAVPAVHLFALFPCALALFCLAWSSRYERMYLPLAGVFTAVFGVLIAMFVALALLDGKSEQLASLTLLLFGTFFFAGLLFRQALTAAALTLTAFACTAYVAGLPLPAFMKSMMIMASASGLAAIVYRDVEQSYRRNFLESAFIGELVARDALSGLMNRRVFDEHLVRVWSQAIRDQRPVTLFMIDIDHFKKYNDEWGHQAGDWALRSVAKVIQGFARRPLDLAARYGGEEFAVILYDLPFAHVKFLAERLLESVQDLKPEAVTGGPGVTVSVGVGFAMPSISRTAEGVVQLADEALYEAKGAGRNCIITKGAEDHSFLITGSFNKAEKGRTVEPAG